MDTYIRHAVLRARLIISTELSDIAGTAQGGDLFSKAALGTSARTVEGDFSWNNGTFDEMLRAQYSVADERSEDHSGGTMKDFDAY